MRFRAVFPYLIAAFASTGAIAAPKSAPVKKPTFKQVRVSQARELLGRHYAKSTVKVGEQLTNIRPLLEEWAREGMPRHHRKKSKAMVRAVVEASRKHGFDPIFLMAVIESESTFHPGRNGGHGEIGLMQIKPDTAEWISKKTGQKWKGKWSLYDPATNIRIGASYLAYLRDRFDSHARLYLSAYNMGARRVDKHLENKVWPKEYVTRVMGNYVEYYEEVKLRLLAKNPQIIASVE